MAEIDFLKLSKLPKELSKANIHLTIPKGFVNDPSLKRDEQDRVRQEDLDRAVKIVVERKRAFGFKNHRLMSENKFSWFFMVSP